MAMDTDIETMMAATESENIWGNDKSKVAGEEEGQQGQLEARWTSLAHFPWASLDSAVSAC